MSSKIKDILQTILLFIAIFYASLGITDAMGVDEDSVFVVSLSLAFIIVYVWKRIDGRYFKIVSENQELSSAMSQNKSPVETRNKKELSNVFDISSFPDNECLLYSRWWEKSGIGLSLVAKRDVDILVTEKNLYVVKFPKPIFKRILGFAIVLFGFILPGLLLVEYWDKKSRDKIRSTWLGRDNNLFSNEYLKYVVMQIPFSEVVKSLSVEGGHFRLKEKAMRVFYHGQEIDLKYRKEEYERIIEFVNNLKTLD